VPTIPPLVLLAFAILLILLAACHFFQGWRHKNHAPTRKGPDDASPLSRLTTALLLALPGMLITGSVRTGPVAHGQQAAPDNTKRAKEIMKNTGAEDISSAGESSSNVAKA
jgi:hypothetical protein